MRKAFNIPDVFSPKKGGCGAIQTTVGNASVFSIQAAKIKYLEKYPEQERSEKRGKLVAYYSEVSHGHIIKGVLMHGITHYREISTKWDKDQKNFIFDTEKLEQQIETDIKEGLIPFFIMGVVGATPSGGHDNLHELGKISKKYDLFLMIDAAWGGNFTILDSEKHIIDGCEHADAYCFNPSKFIGSGMDSCILYFRDKNDYFGAFQQDSSSQIALNELKLGDSTKTALFKYHFLFQMYGLKGIRLNAQKAIENAIFFEDMVKAENR